MKIRPIEKAIYYRPLQNGGLGLRGQKRDWGAVRGDYPQGKAESGPVAFPI